LKVPWPLESLSISVPMNAAYSADRLSELEATLVQAAQAEQNARLALDVACEQAKASEWALHDAIICAKAQVIAQYGSDSFAVQAIGLKRKSDRRRPTRRYSAAPKA
jgi:hypothetical protein